MKPELLWRPDVGRVLAPSDVGDVTPYQLAQALTVAASL